MKDIPMRSQLLRPIVDLVIKQRKKNSRFSVLNVYEDPGYASVCEYTIQINFHIVLCSHTRVPLTIVLITSSSVLGWERVKILISHDVEVTFIIRLFIPAIYHYV